MEKKQIVDTLPNAKGEEFRVGDRIRVKGSKVERTIAQIHSDGQVVAQRVTYGPAPSAWTHVDRITHN